MRHSTKIRMLVADDHYLVRMGVISTVSTEPDLEVVAEAANGLQAVELFLKLAPNLVLMDLSMPVKDGIQATLEIRSQFPAARILRLTTFDGDDGIHKLSPNLGKRTQNHRDKSAWPCALES